MNPLINIDNLSKIFGTYISRARVTSLRDISFQVNRGERVCLFGPNGAGKSTIMKSIMGLIKPTKGKILVKDYNAFRKQLLVKKVIGYLPSDLNFYLDTPCEESLYHFGTLRGLPRKEVKDEVKRLLKMVGLEKWSDLPPKLMSSGMRQRFSLALAIIGEPEIILFDEPVSFIDVQGKLKIYQLVQEYVKDESKTVIMSTHNIQDALIMSDRIIVIDRGQIIIDGPITEVVTQRCKSMEIILAINKTSKKQIEQAIGEVNYELAGRKIIIKADDALQISVDVVNKLNSNKIEVFSYRPFVEQRRKQTEEVEEEAS